MSNGPSGKALAIVALMGVLGVAALAWYVTSTPKAQHVPDSLRTPAIENRAPRSGSDAGNSGGSESTPSKQETVRVPSIDAEKVSLSQSETPVPGGKDAKIFLAEQILSEVNIKGVHVLGVDVRNHSAAINFSKGLDGGMGSMQEGSFLTALQMGFSQFPDVLRIQIEQDGQPLDSLGHVELTDPLPVIKPPSPGSSKPYAGSGPPSEG